MTGAHIPAAQLGEVAWTKSRRSATVANCVEAGKHDGGVAVRNSNDPASGALLFTPPEWAAFVGGVKDGDFDHLI